MKMTLRMRNANFELEFDEIEEACEFINIFMRNNPTASLINMEDFEKKQILNQAATTAAEILGISKQDPTFKAAVEIASDLIGLNRYDN